MVKSYHKKVSLARAISKLGYTSRKQAEQLIKDGVVKVNNQIIHKVSYKVDLIKDKISINGKILKKEKLVYILLNKPEGYITTRSDELNRKTVYDLLKGINQWVFPVGRLDKDTSGLILFTNDNKMGEILTNPESEIPKTYLVKINRPILDNDLKTLRNGVIILKNYKTQPAEISILNKIKDELLITICEGKNRQIRRMFEALNYKVEKLVRIKIGNIGIGNLKTGEWRYLTNKEVSKLNYKIYE